MLVSRLAALVFLALAAAPSRAADDVASQLPAGTLVHMRFSGLADLGQRLEGTSALALWREPELVAFLAPALEGLHDDLAFLVREADQALADLALGERLPGALSVSLTELGGDPDDEDSIEVSLAATLELGPSAAAVFEAVAKRAQKDEGKNFQRLRRHGREAFRIIDDERDDRIVELAIDGERLVGTLSLHGELPDLLGEPPAASLSASETYQGVLQLLEVDDPLLLGFVDVAACRAAVRAMLDENDELEADGKLMARTLLEAPMYQALDGMGWALARDGAALRDRIALLAPRDPEALGASGPLEDTLARHGALADPQADLFLSTWYDLADARKRSAAEARRIRALYDELDQEFTEALEKQADVLTTAANSIEDATGVDLLGLLEPALGTRLSLFVSAPPSALSMPDAGLIVDLADTEAFDEVLDIVVLMDDRIEQVNFSRQDHEGHELLTIKLVGAGVPLLPTLVRLDDQLLVTTTALAMKNLLSGIAAGRTLAADERFADFAAAADGQDQMTLWCDVGAVFNYLYGFLGMGLGMARSSGADITERFDASLLPDGELLAGHFGLGSVSSRRVGAGWIYEGHSTLANPAVGVIGGALGVAGLVGLSAATEEAARDARRALSKEHLLELAKALEAYRTSVGGGSYPDDLVKLVDRGLLTDVGLLADSSDEKPKRTRTGTGERVPVSYALGSLAALPASLRENLPDTASHVLFTRGAWYEDRAGFRDDDGWRIRSGEVRFAVVLGGEHTVITVFDEDWGG